MRRRHRRRMRKAADATTGLPLILSSAAPHLPKHNEDRQEGQALFSRAHLEEEESRGE